MKIFTALECVADDQIEDGRPARWSGCGLCSFRSFERRWNNHHNSRAGLRTWLGVRRCSKRFIRRISGWSGIGPA